jgi:branched-chain amino acid transport system ATP-binding protein
LTVRDLDVYYGGLQAVRTLSLRVEEGQLVTLLGANGAGKTSVIRAIAGLVRVPGDGIAFDGRNIDRLRPARRVSLGIATVAEGRELFPSLTVAENLRMGAYRRRDRQSIRRELDWIYGMFPPLSAKRGDRSASLSGGEGQMLAIGRALMSGPRLLLLDEPSHGLAPLVVKQIFDLVTRLTKERNLAILLVEQNAHLALAVASYGYVLEAGVLSLEGPTTELVRDPRVRQLYLGG